MPIWAVKGFFLFFFLLSKKNPPIFLFRYPFSLLITGLFHCLPQLPPFDAPLEGIWSPSMISTFFFCPSPTPAFFPSPEWCHSASDHRRSEGVSEASDGSLSLQINRPCPLTLSQSLSSPYFHFHSAISSFSPISSQMFENWSDFPPHLSYLFRRLSNTFSKRCCDHKLSTLWWKSLLPQKLQGQLALASSVSNDPSFRASVGAEAKSQECQNLRSLTRLFIAVRKCQFLFSLFLQAASGSYPH